MTYPPKRHRVCRECGEKAYSTYYRDMEKKFRTLNRYYCVRCNKLWYLADVW